ncbi:MAG: apolipoprotein N-acyltransferase, partial [Alistipes sp.]|nr:apolipoprotein N-acyltransferase [Alistipes sp.]
MQRKLLYLFASVLLLSLGWWGVSGLPLLVALIPLLHISASYSDSKRDWWRMAGWASLTFVLWNALTVWWVWNATPIGPIAATAFSTFWNLVAFMSYHYVSKRAHKSVAYTLLIVAWVATEYLYTHAEVLSFPWLVLGNGFSGEVWAVQWYEFTGVMGGSLWVVMANVAIYEAWQNRYGWSILRAALVVVAPII